MGVNAMLTLGTLASVGTAHVVHTELYLGGRWVVLILLSVAAGAALFVAFRLMDEQREGGIVLSAAALAGLGIVVVDYWLNRNAPVFGDTTNIREISFQETPNLYFVSFDALAPRALLNKHLQLETTDFHDLFEERFRRFPNLFVEATPTEHSLYTILSLDAAVYASQLKSLRKSGERPRSSQPVFRSESEPAVQHPAQERLRDHNDLQGPHVRQKEGPLCGQLYNDIQAYDLQLAGS